MNLVVSFNKSGYEPFLDFLKGLCIICVVLTHSMTTDMQNSCLFPFWGAVAVPIFLTISCFHYLKKPQTYDWAYIKKVCKRVFIPFLIVQTLLFGIIVLKYLMGSGVLSSPIKAMLIHGGAGPGTYFVWVYLQLTLILLPLFAQIINRNNYSTNCLLALLAVVSLAVEVASNWLNIPLWIHRLTCLPYIFLIYYGFRLATGAIKIKSIHFALSFFSALAVFLFNYTNLDFSPFVYMDTARNFHIYCYPFMLYALIMPLKIIHDRLLATPILGGYFVDYQHIKINRKIFISNIHFANAGICNHT